MKNLGNGSVGKHEPLIPVAMILLVSAVQMLTSPPWMFSPEGIDAWFYHGYFVNLKHHITAFSGSYYGTRLAWILPGYFVNSILSPLTANFVLRIVLYWTSITSVFFFTRRFYGVRCALVVSLLFCADTDFLHAIGWDYVDGAGIAYSLLGFEELGAAVARRNSGQSAWLRAGVAGIAFAAAFHSNVFLFFLVIPILLFLVGRSGVKGLSLTPSIVTGGVFLTACLGLLDLAAGGRFLFFAPSLVQSSAMTKVNPYYVNPSLWVSAAWWLVIPFATCFAGLAMIPGWIWRESWKESRDRVVGVSCALSVLSVFIFLNALGQPVLQLPFYSSYLEIFTPFAAAAIIGRRLDSWRAASFVTLVGGCASLSLMVGTNPGSWLPTWAALVYQSLEIRPAVSATTVTVVFAAAIVLAVYIPYRVIARVTIVLAVSLVALRIEHIGLNESLGRSDRRDLYLDVDRTSRELTRLSHGQTLWFWYGYGPGKDQHYSSIASTYLWATMLLGRNLPNIADLRFDAIKPGVFVAVMESDDALREQAIAALQTNGVALERVASLVSTIGASRYVTTLVRITGVDSPPIVYSESPSSDTILPGPEVLDLDLPDLIAHTSRTFYGKAAASTESTPLGILRITDSRDHCATTYQAIEDFGSVDAVEITVVDQSASKKYGTVRMVFQDQNYKTLYFSGTLPNGEARSVVGLPAGTKTIRLAFLANDDGYIRFPQHVHIEARRIRR